MMEFKSAVGYISTFYKENTPEYYKEIEEQKKSILLYAYENGYQIVEWKIDEVSDNYDSRPALQTVLYDGDGKTAINVMIVLNNEILSKDMKLYFYYYYILEKKNVKLITIEEKFAGGEEFATLYKSILQFVAEKERKNIALRTGRGRSIKAACGGYSGGRAPYGYKVESGRLVINEQERPMVEYIFKEKAKGTAMLTIATKLNSLGFTTRKGTMFYTQNIKNILKNEPLYREMYKYGKDMNWVIGVHEPILKDDN